MNKMPRRLLAILLLATIVLSSCQGMPEGMNFIDETKEASADDKSVGASSDEENKLNETIMADLNQITEQLVELSDETNRLCYPLDENFFLWFYSRYGEELYCRLYDEISNGQEAEVYRELTGNTLHVLWYYYCKELGLWQEDSENIYEKASTNSTDIIMDFTGDINLSENWKNMKTYEAKGKPITDYFVNGLSDEMRRVDLLMINNEYCYGTGGVPLEGKAYTFMAKPKRAKLLKELGVDIVSVANNHVYDYGEDGFLSTLETLEKNEIPYVGAGRNLEEASKIVYYIINGKKIAITAATQIERSYHYTKEAGVDSPGVLKTLNPNQYVKVIQKARRNADYVICFVHWGTEDTPHYQSDQVELARTFAKAGADVIVGGHTHCLQGLSYVEGVPVYYSLGNFWFDWKKSGKRTGLAQVILHEDGTSDYRFLPCYYDKEVISLLDGEEKAGALYYMKTLSEGVKLDEDGYYKREEGE